MSIGQQSTLDALVERARDGDPGALEAIVEQASRIAEAQLPARVAHLDRDDLVQETLLRVWRNLPRFAVTRRDSFRRWVCTIARNVLTDQRRRPQAGALRDEPQDACSDPVEALARRDRREWLARGLRKLPENWRRCLVRRYAREEEVDRVARRMRCTRRSVHGLTRRGVERLVEVLRLSA